jgi:hypothetical protein
MGYVRHARCTPVGDVRATGSILTLFIVLSTGCLFALPPSRTELGYAAGDGVQPRMRVATGMHLASVVPAPSTRLELGVGMMYEVGNAGNMTSSTKGPYADVGVAVLRNDYARVLVGLRGERRWRAHEMHYGTKLRVDLEMFAHGHGDFAEAGSCGFITGSHFGMTGLGVYAEAGAAWLPGDPEWLATAGVTLRLPTVAGIAIGGGCKNGGDSGGSGSSGSRPFKNS